MQQFPRRNFIVAALLTPLALALPSLVLAKDAGAPPADALPESDPLGNAMKYKADASKAGPERTNKKAFCNNCAKFNKCAPGATCKTVAKSAAYAPCEIFAGKEVSRNGWCMSWTKV